MTVFLRDIEMKTGTVKIRFLWSRRRRETEMRFSKILRFVMELSTLLRTESRILRDISRAAEGVVTEIIGPSVIDVRNNPLMLALAG